MPYYKKNYRGGQFPGVYQKPVTPATGQALKQHRKLSSDEEQILQRHFMRIKDDELKISIERMKSGHYSRIAHLYDITKWYEKHGFVTQKQYDLLKKYVFDKENDPKNFKDLIEEIVHGN